MNRTTLYLIKVLIRNWKEVFIIVKLKKTIQIISFWLQKIILAIPLMFFNFDI